MKESINFNICFYFPYKEVSGVPLLFVRLANQLSLNYPKAKISCIDYIDGVMAKRLRPGVSLIEFKNGSTVIPPQDSILIMQSILPYRIRRELKIMPNTKIVQWNLHPDCLVPIFLPLPILRNVQKNYYLYSLLGKTFFQKLIHRVRVYTKCFLDNNALWFMDYPNLENTNKHLFTNIRNVQYLPVPIDSTNKKIQRDLDSSVPLKFCWIGRLCDFKISILIYFINKLKVLAVDLKIRIELNIIGDGPSRNQLNSLLPCTNFYFKINYKGSIEPEELDDYLYNEIDVVAAMGTSALESAKFGIPTILLDYSYEPIYGDYKFRWLHDTKDFDLGHQLNKKDFKEGNNSLQIMISELITNYNQLSDFSFNYFQENHEMKNFLNRFIQKVADVKMTYADLDSKLLGVHPIRKMYNLLKT